MLTPALVGIAALGAGLIMSGPANHPRRRLARWSALRRGEEEPRPGPGSSRRRRLCLAGAVGIASVVGFGPALGAVIGLAGAVGVLVVRGHERAAVAPADEAALVIELLAGCLDAGLSMAGGLDATAIAAEPVIAAACRSAASALRRGDPPEAAWESWLADPNLAAAARAAARGGLTGAASAADLRRCAARIRASRRIAVRRRVQQASVWLTAPLGLCFLPAFVCVAVVPTVLGLFPRLG